MATEVDGEFDADDASPYDLALPASETGQPPTASNTTVLSAKQQHPSLPLLLDGGANCTIFTTTAGMTNVRPANIRIEVGGGVVLCKLIGDFTGYIKGHSKRTLTISDARVCPDFGHNIIAEGRFIDKGYTINKRPDVCHIEKDGKTIFTAPRNANGLYYIDVHPSTDTVHVATQPPPTPEADCTSVAGAGRC